MQKIERSSNIELLRIVAMLMVVLGHYYLKGGFPDDSLMNVNKLLMQFLGSWSKIAVDIFVIISGYFLVTQKFKWTKLVKFFSCTYFWSLATLGTALFLLNLDISKSMIIKAVNPFTPLNWFARAYLLLYIIFPLLNKLIKYLGKTKLSIFISILTTVFYIIPTIKGSSLGGYLNSLFMFADMYFIGAYLRLYGSDKLEKTIEYWGGTSAVIFYSTILALDYMGRYDSYYMVKENVMIFAFVGCNIFGLIMATAIFVIFTNWKLSYNKVINTIASTTFAVYLIHDNGVIGAWLWNDLIQANKFYGSVWLIPHMLITASAIFTVCGVLEYVRIRLVEKSLMSKMSTLIERHS